MAKYNIDEDFFLDMKNENASYVFGLIMADGNLRHVGNTIRISLVSTDEAILSKITKLLQPDKPIRHSKPKNGQLQSYIDISNEAITKKLKSCGLTPNKSLTSRYPFGIVDDRSFLRGYIDGNGGMSCGNLAITSNQKMLDDIEIAINSNIGRIIPIRKYDEHSKSGIIYTYYIRFIKDRKEIFNWMYGKCELYIDRKREKAIRIVNGENVRNTKLKKSE